MPLAACEVFAYRLRPMTHDPPFEIVSETEMGDGWFFEVRLAERPAVLTLRLSWADYDLWSADGTDAPHAVATAVIRFLLSHTPAADLPEQIDASTARRRYPGADERIPGLI